MTDKTKDNDNKLPGGRRTRVPRVFTGCSKSPIMLAMEEMTVCCLKGP